MYRKGKQKIKSIFKKFFPFRVGAGGLHCQSSKGERDIFIFPTFFLVRASRKDTLSEFETDIKMPPYTPPSETFEVTLRERRFKIC